MIKLFVIIFLFICDIVSKKLVFSFIDLNSFIMINSVFDLTHIHNFGISFGLLSGIFPSQIFIIIGIILTLIIFYMMIKSTKVLEKWGFLLIISGAVSNIVDRALNNYVIDFIYLHYKDFYWPAFNFADIYISVGVLIIILQILKDLSLRIKK